MRNNLLDTLSESDVFAACSNSTMPVAAETQAKTEFQPDTEAQALRRLVLEQDRSRVRGDKG